MKKWFLLLSFVSMLSLASCNGGGGKKVTYEEFYQKTQEVESHQYSHATMSLSYMDSISGDGKTNERTYKYTWSAELKAFVADEKYDADLANDLNRNVKDIYAKRPKEDEEMITLGYQYFIEPFRVYIDFTETMEFRTVRTIQSSTYDKYGYITDYLLEASVHGTYDDKPINGTQKMAYTVSYN